MNNNKFKIKYLILVLVLVFTNIYLKRWEHTKIIDWDIVSYYAYLPATFIHKDLSLKFIEGKEKEYFERRQFFPETAPNGSKVIKTTMGMSIIYLPFFIIAHNLAPLLGYPNDGFSQIYHIAIHFGFSIYLFIGLWYLHRLLIIFFKPINVFFGIITVIFGTNLFYYSTSESVMSHVFTFSLGSIFLFFSNKILSNWRIRDSIILGLVGGLLVLLRPTNIVYFLFPLFIIVQNYKQFNERILFFIRDYKKVLLIAFIAFLVILPQILYWKILTGNFLFNSYVNERFYFDSPLFLKGLFSFRKGWLIYSPLMILSIVGIYNLFKAHKSVFLPIFFITFFYMYLIFSWWNWWYGGSFGMRPMIDIYPLLLFSVVAFIEGVNKLKPLFYSLVVIFIFLNLFQTYQYRKIIIHWDSMNYETYTQNFFKTKFDEECHSKISPPNYDGALEGIR
jgi:hypothetical protein